MRCTLKNVPPTAAFSAADWEKGTRVELEHTRDPECAAAIAAHHLLESPRYYEELEKMEEGLGIDGYKSNPDFSTLYGTLVVASTGASAYHGYKRNNSVGWAIVWGLLGGLFPVITPAVAIWQGFGEPKQ